MLLPQITEYRFLKVNYESMVDWRQWTDYLRCSPMFHNSPRYDCVIIKTVNGEILAQLVFLFTCQVDGIPYPIALVQTYDAPAGRRTIKDRDLSFYRVRAKPRASCEFISVQSIVRGVFLAAESDTEKPGEFLVVDSVDTDMFLRMKAMYP